MGSGEREGPREGYGGSTWGLEQRTFTWPQRLDDDVLLQELRRGGLFVGLNSCSIWNGLFISGVLDSQRFKICRITYLIRILVHATINFLTLDWC